MNVDFIVKNMKGQNENVATRPDYVQNAFNVMLRYAKSKRFIFKFLILLKFCFR